MIFFFIISLFLWVCNCAFRTPSTNVYGVPSENFVERAVAEGAGERGNSGDVSRRSLNTDRSKLLRLRLRSSLRKLRLTPPFSSTPPTYQN